MATQKGVNCIKLLTLGNSMVGKSSLIARFIDNKFFDSYISTIGIDFFKKKVKIGVNEIDLQIYDSAGQEKYKSISKQYYHNSEGILLVFDLTSQESFVALDEWIEDLEKVEKDLPIILVGNKSDLDARDVSEEEINKIINDKKFDYFETSALNGSNVNEAFIKLTELVIKHKKSRRNTRKGMSIHSLNNPNNKKCC
jgi:small GTP-binding protein